MGIITLTDRISVSVRAKNETESNSQKRATGKNIANALTSGGSADISDALADQLGNTSKPTITDEQGREWVAMSDIIAAGKKMQQEGAFEKNTSYRYGNVAAIDVRSLPWNWFGRIGGTGSDPIYGERFGPINTAGYLIQPGNQVLVSNDPPTYSYPGGYRIGIIKYENLYYVLDNGWPSHAASNGSQSFDTMEDFIAYSGIPVTEVGQRLLSLSAYGEEQEIQSGGSLIDWTKPDDEIEEDIRNLHETWDVTEHAGSVTANGTYVLAGPIEFNPGD